jgi:hypothetical protein
VNSSTKVSPFLEFFAATQRIFSRSRHKSEAVGMEFDFQLLCHDFNKLA